MSKFILFQDEKKCISCRSCQVQCKVNKGLGVGPKPNQIIEVGPVEVNGRLKANYVFLSCFHCDNPWCIAACPNGAIQKREEDGVIFIDQDRCAGCKSCIMACPWSAPQWDARKGKAVKCDLCKDRIDAGLKPACVTACPTNSLRLVRTEDLPDTKRVRFVRELVARGVS
ncbi:4Fe-4S ferredoxin iron-sulfur binding domain-containing protein [Desulfotomaculum nigrificans CO-1-SRB]|uniref:4Fe-4S ferredoxin iron-sulfur binding domain-containing protein n=1 Tax=Desulfotomaculum nigrificans (strain DSM 14880 / VKM B-2319 / CO-1-SRB) TaxID=868595 RepID=F6B2M3_DESCC|nr:4Fe-4S dicluster domain-containing protein [Desulfotomaculum nigrificans]AEF93852.1 4Fe-4S ferredoxin iron-sulfur binding domain-containing protein [Desulfotomaculum nigrificans CO-1-SRB]